MKFGHRLHGVIQHYDDKGRGTFEIQAAQQTTPQTIVVPFTAIGDDVIATFFHRDRGMKIARLESITTPSKDRITPICPHAGKCGGCLWQHLAYSAQLETKKMMINRALERAGHEERIVDLPSHMELLDDAPPFFYRNRMDYAVGWNGEIGLKEHGAWNRYVNVQTCALLHKDVEHILEEVRCWMHEQDLQPWDAKMYTGDIRYVVLREGKHTQERMIIIVVKDVERIGSAQEKISTELVRRLSPLCTSLLLGEQSKQTDLSFSQRFITLKGNPWIEETANDVRYRISPNSFFQTNTIMAEQLQKTVYDIIETVHPAAILDLYCGLGFFGIYLASRIPDLRVAGFELDTEAIELATHNARVNGVADRCEFTSGPAEDLSWKNTTAEVVILDPPRSGLHPNVLKTLLEKKPKTIIYISCHYQRLAEELKVFKTLYAVESLRAFDLFPHTPHVEVIAHLCIRETS